MIRDLGAWDHVVLTVACLALAIDGLVLAVVLHDKIREAAEVRRELRRARELMGRESKTPVEGVKKL